MALVWLLSNCYQKTSRSAANPHKYWVFTVLRFIPTRQYKHIIGFHTIDMENDGI